MAVKSRLWWPNMDAAAYNARRRKFWHLVYRWRIAVLTTLVLLTVLALGQTGEKATVDAKLADKVKTLVGREGLGHAELAKREAAEKALVELGPEVLPLLPTVTPRMPAEDKLRLQRVRGVLEGAAIAATTKPSLVTLAGEMPFSEGIAKISQQTGNKLVD